MMTGESGPTFAQVSAALGPGAELTGEGHGLLCGLLSALGPAAELGYWLDQVVDTEHPPQGEDLATLERLFEATRAGFDDPELGFRLLLPDDDEPLAERLLALGQWCSGFLGGLALGGLAEGAPLPGDAGEALHDLAEIARVDFDVGEGGEDEAAYAEVVEFVRMAALLVSEELTPLRQGRGANDHLH